MGEIFKNRVLSAFPIEIRFFIAFSDFVPPSLKGKGDRGKGSIARNLPINALRIQKEKIAEFPLYNPERL